MAKSISGRSSSCILSCRHSQSCQHSTAVSVKLSLSITDTHSYRKESSACHPLSNGFIDKSIITVTIANRSQRVAAKRKRWWDSLNIERARIAVWELSYRLWSATEEDRLSWIFSDQWPVTISVPLITTLALKWNFIILHLSVWIQFSPPMSIWSSHTDQQLFSIGSILLLTPTSLYLITAHYFALRQKGRGKSKKNNKIKSGRTTKDTTAGCHWCGTLVHCTTAWCQNAFVASFSTILC